MSVAEPCTPQNRPLRPHTPSHEPWRDLTSAGQRVGFFVSSVWLAVHEASRVRGAAGGGGGKAMHSSWGGGTTDAADLELLAFPPCNRNEEQRELFELPHPRPLRRVMAARTGADISGAKILLLGAIAEDEEQHDTTVGDYRCSDPARLSSA